VKRASLNAAFIRGKTVVNLSEAKKLFEDSSYSIEVLISS
jgi:hypothetical protein